MTLRSLLIAVAVIALLLTFARLAAVRLLGRRPGGWYHSVYWYFDEDWKYHEFRGNIIYDSGTFIVGD